MDDFGDRGDSHVRYGVGGAGVRLDKHGLRFGIGERDTEFFKDLRFAWVTIGVFLEAEDTEDTDDVADGDAARVVALGAANFGRRDDSQPSKTSTPSWLVGFVGGKTGITYRTHAPLTDGHIAYSSASKATGAMPGASGFGEPPESAELSEDFVGLRHRPRDDGTIEISCDGIIKKLHGLIADRPLAHGTVCTSPLPDKAMFLLRNSRHAGDPHIPDEAPFAQQVGGTIGFITIAVPYAPTPTSPTPPSPDTSTRPSSPGRPSIYFLRIAHYLVFTMHLHLHLAAPERTIGPHGASGLDLFQIHAASSHGNAEGASDTAASSS